MTATGGRREGLTSKNTARKVCDFDTGRQVGPASNAYLEFWPQRADSRKGTRQTVQIARELSYPLSDT